MLYAEVVLGLPLEGAFDYIVPEVFRKKIKVGSRVTMPFRNQRMLGYVIRLKTKTKIRNLKSILEVIDDSAILDKRAILLAKGLSDYYCCSLGQAIETALPQDLRKGRKLNADSRGLHADGRGFLNEQNLGISALKDNIVLVHDLDGEARWNVYLESIKEVLDNGKSVIFLLPDRSSILAAREKIGLGLGLPAQVLYRGQGTELDEWLKIKTGKSRIIVGSRSAIFAPLYNLGLIIIDEEQSSSYKQEQTPHYNAREIAFIRMAIEKTKLILASRSPSLESFYLAKQNKIGYMFIPPKQDPPEIKIIDTKRLPESGEKRGAILSRYLQDSIVSVLNSGGKVLLFLNRKGFATSAACRNCGVVLKCSRCQINLVYHFKNNLLNCHYCDFKMPAPKICPNCNSSYIRYSGAGTERIESEVARLFPQAKIKRLDEKKAADAKDADIVISTNSIIGQVKYNFDLAVVFAIDNSFNRIDFRSTEKTFALLAGLLRLTRQKLLIQTKLVNHYCFGALINKNINIFYDAELEQRKQLNFPPYGHIGLVKLRGKNEEKVKKISNDLFERLNRANKNKKIKITSVNAGQPMKLRGNFYWQIFIASDRAQRLSRFLKMRLKNFSHSGVIVTVDIDPI